TFLLSGLWHGASWTFVAWGALYGIIYLLEIPVLKFTQGKNWSRFPGWIYLVSAHSLIMVAFRAGSISDTWTFYSKIFSFDWNAGSSFAELKHLNDLFPLVLSVFLVVFLFVKETQEEFFPLREGKTGSILRPALYVMIFLGIFLIGQFNANEFIYFHF
ncbi:MAG TPA: hypothetical protein VFU15_03760, partial [Bacteroidia bacterium]|nr:hypothetical protein [Bacteroidia bacterium]